MKRDPIKECRLTNYQKLNHEHEWKEWIWAGHECIQCDQCDIYAMRSVSRGDIDWARFPIKEWKKIKAQIDEIERRQRQ